MQPLRLPQFEDLAVVEGVDFVLEKLQRGGLAGQRPGDLLSHHLHHLEADTWTVDFFLHFYDNKQGITGNNRHQLDN